MSNGFSALLEQLGSDEFIAFDGDNETFTIPNSVTTYKANEPLIQTEEIFTPQGRLEVNTKTLITSPVLSSITLRSTVTEDRPPEDPRIDFTATVVCERKIWFENSVGDWVSDQDFILSALRQNRPNLNKTDTQLMLMLASYGLDIRSGLPMYLQHLGAGIDEFNEIAVNFRHQGAIDKALNVQASATGVKSKVLQSWRHPEGIPIASMDISKVNRGASTQMVDNTVNPYGTGFIGFADGMFNTFLQILRADAERSALRQVQPSDTEAYAAAARREQELRRLFTASKLRRAFHNWGGTTRIVKKDLLDPNATNIEEVFYPQQVPCGRMHVASGFGPTDTMLYSVWSSRKKSADLPIIGENTVGIESELMNLGLLPDVDTTGY